MLQFQKRIRIKVDFSDSRLLRKFFISIVITFAKVQKPNSIDVS